MLMKRAEHNNKNSIFCEHSSFGLFHFVSGDIFEHRCNRNEREISITNHPVTPHGILNYCFFISKVCCWVIVAVAAAGVVVGFVNFHFIFYLSNGAHGFL